MDAQDFVRLTKANLAAWSIGAPRDIVEREVTLLVRVNKAFGLEQYGHVRLREEEGSVWCVCAYDSL